VAFDIDCADVNWGRRVTGSATSAGDDVSSNGSSGAQASEEEANVTLTMVPGPAKAKADSSSDGKCPQMLHCHLPDTVLQSCSWR
jgi:hypothetical protein